MFVVAFVCFFNGLRKKRQAEGAALDRGGVRSFLFSLPRSRTASMALAVHRLCFLPREVHERLAFRPFSFSERRLTN